MSQPSERQLPLFGDASPSQSSAATDQHKNILALSKVRGVGEASLKALVRTFGDLNRVWEVPRDELATVLSRAGLRAAPEVVSRISGHKSELWREAEKELEWLERQQIHLITIQDASFPSSLREIKDAPQWLFVQGNVSILSHATLVAVVGTREASPSGIELTRRLCVWLAKHSYGIVSGLAEGIDATAHQTALDFGTPTVAVLGTGISVVFPAATGHLRRQIVDEGGSVITEYLPHQSYSRANFVRRNRIQAALSIAVVPIEGQISSGTAHTYRFARDFHRSVFGVTSRDKPNRSELIQLLTREGYPVVDLDSPSEMSGLETRLLQIADGVISPSSHAKAPPLFATLKREFERVIDSYNLSEDEVKQLTADLLAIWEKKSHGG